MDVLLINLPHLNPSPPLASRSHVTSACCAALHSVLVCQEEMVADLRGVLTLQNKIFCCALPLVQYKRQWHSCYDRLLFEEPFQNRKYWIEHLFSHSWPRIKKQHGLKIVVQLHQIENLTRQVERFSKPSNLICISIWIRTKKRAGGSGPLRKNLEGHWINFPCITFKAGQPEASYFCEWRQLSLPHSGPWSAGVKLNSCQRESEEEKKSLCCCPLLIF